MSARLFFVLYCALVTLLSAEARSVRLRRIPQCTKSFFVWPELDPGSRPPSVGKLNVPPNRLPFNVLIRLITD